MNKLLSVLLTVCLGVLAMISPALAAEPNLKLKSCFSTKSPQMFKPRKLRTAKVVLNGVRYLRYEKVQVEDAGTTEVFLNARGVCRGPHTVIHKVVVYITKRWVPVESSSGVATKTEVTPLAFETRFTVGKRKAKSPSRHKKHRPYGGEIGEPYGPVTVTEPEQVSEGGGG